MNTALLSSRCSFFLTAVCFVGLLTSRGGAAELAARLLARSPETIAAQARMRGDPVRGSVIFHTSAAGCIKCHSDGSTPSPLGPKLTNISREVSDAHLIEAILQPSRSISKGYETVAVVTTDGRVRTGMIASQDGQQVVLRELTDLLDPTAIPREDIDEIEQLPTSMMPEGLVDSLQSERAFFDLLRYLFEVVRGGPERAAALRPSPADLVINDDTVGLDHAGILRRLGDRDRAAGKQIYFGHCKNCHGLDGNEPTLPLARAFGREALKNGADPYRMLLTLTKGYGLMAPVQHLSPKERYQVIHYIREALMKPSNPAYEPIDEAYLSGLPPGTHSGEPSVGRPRDFGPALGSQIGSRVNNALTIRLDADTTAAYDLHQMRLVGVWKDGFLDLSNTQHYRQRGEGMPEITGTLLPGLDGWQWAFAGSFDLPADAKPPRGPLREDLLHYAGYSLHGADIILHYAIEGRAVLESPSVRSSPHGDIIEHTLQVGPGTIPLTLCVAQLANPTEASGVYPSFAATAKQPRAAAADHTAVVTATAAAVAAQAKGDIAGCSWEVRPDGRMVFTIPAATNARKIQLALLPTARPEITECLRALRVEPVPPIPDLSARLQGGPRRWTETITVTGRLGAAINGYALDTIPVPFENRWNAWLRTSGLDFFPDGRAVVTTHGGDVYLVSGIDTDLKTVVWQRFAAGLFEPFGVRVVDGKIYVTCRDGIKRLHDKNGDGEADFIEAFWNDDDVSCMFHAYNFDLQTDEAGNFYFAKAGQYTEHHRPGTIMKIPPEGGRAEVVAWGLRTPNGMGRLADGRFTVSDNQGPWMPAGKISAVEPDGFYGNMPINAAQERWLRDHNDGELPGDFDEPFIWMPQELDNSCGGQVWVADPRFGPLSGRLLHASFGKGWLYYLLLDEVADQTQAAIVALPHQWDAGVMRLRVNPADGQVYGVGLSGWQGPAAGKDGCFQRLRWTGKACRLIDSVQATPTGLRLRFSFPLQPKAATNPDNWQAEMWDYRWSKKYGSDQFSVLRSGEKGRDELSITAAALVDSQTVALTIPSLRVCDQLLLQTALKDTDGEPFTEEAYLTIHAIPAVTQ